MKPEGESFHIQRDCPAPPANSAPQAIVSLKPEQRPRIIGISHIRLKTDDLSAARKYYGELLGFHEPFSIDEPPQGPTLAFFKVNDHQYIEVYQGLKDPNEDRLSHIAFETSSAQQLRDYLASRGVKVPEKLEPGTDGNLSFAVTDPDGHSVEFVKYLPG